MPYKSEKQRRWAHSPAGKKALGPEGVKHWDEASKGKDLPEEAATDDDVKGLKRISREQFKGMPKSKFHGPPKGKKQYTRKQKHKGKSESEMLTPPDETYRRYNFPLAELVAGLNWSHWEQETHSDEGYVPAWGYHSVVDRGVDPHEKHEGARKIEQAPSPLPATKSTKKLHKAYALTWKVVGYGHGGYHYNPHVSKPVALEPIGEEGGYHYFGPPPDGGFSYGLYTDGTNTIATKRSPKVFSPISGSPMKFVGDANYDMVRQALSGSKFPNLLHSCGACGNSYVTSADYLKSLSCPACGSASEYANALMRGRRVSKK